MIAVQSSSTLRAQYRKLLTSEWQRGFPDDVLALLWGSVAPAEAADPALKSLLDARSRDPIDAEHFRALASRVGDAGRFLPVVDMPPLPHDYEAPVRPARAVLQALRLSAYLTLHGQVALKGDLCFFRDLQAVGFQAALHFVAPDIGAKHADEHALLLRALALFAVDYAAVDPAHFVYMMSQIHGYLGNTEQRLRCLHAAFRFTPPDDHSFLTKAQEYWSELLDLDRSAEAQEFLFGLHWRSSPAQRDEVREMIVAGLQHAAANGQARK